MESLIPLISVFRFCHVMSEFDELCRKNLSGDGVIFYHKDLHVRFSQGK